MKLRNYLFEFEDLAWFPNTIRESMTDYLRYLITKVDFYRPIAPSIIEELIRTNANQIIDLGSGGGGAIEQIHHDLKQLSETDIKIILTDKYPNTSAYAFLKAKTNGAISFHNSPVDAADVPLSLKGFRTIFSSFHHFDNGLAKAVLKNAVDAKSGIGIFDGGNKNILAILAILIVHPLVFLIFTPFFKPFRFSRILFTYIIPIIPFCTVWDGIVSIIRLYKPTKLMQIANEVEPYAYKWRSGKMKSKYGLNVTFLIGHPIV
ncbi:methyltransferase domain-containing protein [Natronoflexus pectinivorans]|uniref:Methyltransferase family protein n=1 Tax=Natronoflexus pectinivorans TaxID=682526 RepID=A0A4R2GNZ9_9BACT|nr:class I SAM-dependent methyltransferase [Natronoflexus pectinivorans]TCO11074.1 hypothetical protein EV194_101708 [Natronoflexus pectinivorans]